MIKKIFILIGFIFLFSLATLASVSAEKIVLFAIDDFQIFGKGYILSVAFPQEKCVPDPHGKGSAIRFGPVSYRIRMQLYRPVSAELMVST